MSELSNLLSLPNCLILQLLSYLDATSLYLLSKTCVRFSDFIKSHSSLWRRIDARRAPNSSKKTRYCLERCHRETYSFLLRGEQQPDHKQTLLDNEFYIRINIFRNIRILAIENQLIDGTKYTVASFPEGLEEFSLKKSTVQDSLQFFRHSCDHMKNLRVLILDECNWLSTSDFMPISKYPKLEIFSVYKCKGLENSIPYLSLSGFGFKQLKILDVRLSPLGNSLLRSVYRSQTILAIYFQNDDRSYKLDYYKRMFDIEKGAPTRDFFNGDNEFDVVNLFDNGLYYNEETTSLTDNGLMDYSLAGHAKNVFDFPESVLYLDPYNSCNCCYKSKGKRLSKFKHKKNSKKSDDSDDDNDDNKGDGSSPLCTIKNKIKSLSENVNKRVKRSPKKNHYNPRTTSSSSVVINMRTSEGASTRLIHEDAESVCVFNVFNALNSWVDRNIRPSPNRPTSSQNVRKRPAEPSEGPETKRLRSDDEAVPGPSGVNNSPDEVSEESGISDGEEPQPYAERPPTPHPDIVISVSNNNFSRIVNLAPLIQIDPYGGQKKLTVPLRRLSLRGYRTITNTALNHINHLGLEVLDLTYTDITEDAINMYLIDNPFCRVIHEKFCVCLPNLHF